MNLSSKLIRAITLSALLVLLAFCATAQIKGTVTDAITHKPIIAASVYLNGTYVGTITDSLGHFSLTTDKTNIPLIISSVGYVSQEINNYAGKDLAVALKQKVDELKQVNVALDEMSRAKEMKIFLTEFLGGINKDCVLVNQDDVWLHYQKKNEELTAGSFNPLIILNKKLGYKLTYFLADFRNVPLKTTFEGNYIFAEDTAGRSPSDMKKIIKARDEAYFGSRMHFIRSLWADDLANNNFKMFKHDKVPTKMVITPEYHLTTDNQLFYKDVIQVQNTRIYHNQKFLVLTGEINVNYQRTKNAQDNSFLIQNPGYTGVQIDSDGTYGHGIEWKEAMGSSRVNKLLPEEFQPATKLVSLRKYQDNMIKENGLQ